MTKKALTEFEINQLRSWHNLETMLPHLEKMKGVKRESRLLMVYFVVIVLMIGITDFIGEYWLHLTAIGFLIHWVFLYFRNQKRIEQVGKDALPVIMEYQKHINDRADLVGMDRPYTEELIISEPEKSDV